MLSKTLNDMDKINRAITALLILVISSCSSYDDSGSHDVPNEQIIMISLLSRMNANIEALKVIVTVKQQNGFIEYVMPLNAEVRGYELRFSSGEETEIYTDFPDYLKDYTLPIGVRRDSDGIYYWTMNGKWLYNSAGNRPDIIKDFTPKLKIENRAWYITCDPSGVSWETLGSVFGERYGFTDNISIIDEDGYVRFKMPDGTSLSMPKHPDAI